MLDLACEHAALLAPATELVDEQGARLDVHVDRADRLGSAVRPLEADRDAVRELAGPPGVPGERAGSEQAWSPSRAARGRRGRSTSRSMTWPGASSAIDVMVVASSGGKSWRLPVGVDPDPDDRPCVPGAQPLRLAEDARELPDIAGARVDGDEVVGPLELDRAGAEPGGDSRRPRPSSGSRPRRAATRAPAGATWGGSRSRRAAPCPAARSRSGPFATAARGLDVGDRDADLGDAVAEPAGDDVVRRADGVETLEFREPRDDGRIDDVGHRGRRDGAVLIEQPQPPPSRPGPGARARTRRGAPRAPSRGPPRR